MTQTIRTLDSALQAIAAERQALQIGQSSSSFAGVPSSAVPARMPLPPIPRAPGLVNNMPDSLQTITRLDVPPVQTPAHAPQSQNFAPTSPAPMPVSSTASMQTPMPEGSMPMAQIAMDTTAQPSVMKTVMIAAVSVMVGAGSMYAMSSMQGSSDGVALAKTDYKAGWTTGKQNKISAVDSARMNKNCSVIYQDLLTGSTKASGCQSGTNLAGTTQLTQFSTENTSATINPNKFTESLSTSNSKISESLSGNSDTVSYSSGGQFSGNFPSVDSSDISEGPDGGTALKLRPRGIVKKFYATN